MLAEDQSLPENKYFVENEILQGKAFQSKNYFLFERAQQDMISAGFVKVIKE